LLSYLPYKATLEVGRKIEITFLDLGEYLSDRKVLCCDPNALRIPRLDDRLFCLRFLGFDPKLLVRDDPFSAPRFGDQSKAFRWITMALPINSVFTVAAD
jgi:hypothetical protein